MDATGRPSLGSEALSRPGPEGIRWAHLPSGARAGAQDSCDPDPILHASTRARVRSQRDRPRPMWAAAIIPMATASNIF